MIYKWQGNFLKQQNSRVCQFSLPCDSEWKVEMTNQEAEPGFFFNLLKNLKLNFGQKNQRFESTVYFVQKTKEIESS